MRIEFNSVKFKNFRSFGSRYQEMVFQPGINIILGPNGSGKSSLMETIPFALFNKTHIDTRKTELVNWKNRKNLEVILSFSKGNDNYEVVRSVKPDNLEIVKNGATIPRPSHVRDYQAELEEIVGTNFQSFISLIHSNINSSSRSVFNMGKPEKRKFIEKVFGLSLYSELSDMCNKKISSIENKAREYELSISHKKSYIDSSKERVKSIQKKLSTLKDSSVELTDVSERLKEYSSELMDEDSYESIKKEIDNTNLLVLEFESLIHKFNIKENSISSKLKNIKKQIPRKADSDIKSVSEEERKNNSEEIKEVEKTLDETNTLMTTYKTEISMLREKEGLLNKGKCPTCGQKIDDSVIVDLTSDISDREEEIKTCSKFYNEQSRTLKELVKKGEVIDNSIKRRELTRDYRKWERIQDRLLIFRETLECKRNRATDRINILREEYEEETKLRRQVENLKREVEILRERISLEKSTREEMRFIISSDEVKHKEYLKDIGSLEREIEELNNMKDYLDYIKVMCKDENVKAYAIRSILPFLVERTNNYLSDIGHPFYMQLDSWLEPTIKGPGITSGSYNSLSSGEGKSVDLALQSAFLDVYRIQAGVYPDIHILDELLDSSVDSTSLDALLQIISNKQQMDNSKVYVISHRESVVELDATDTIFLTKEGGFSKIV